MKVVEPLVLVLLTKSLSNQYLFQKQNSPENGEFLFYKNGRNGEIWTRDPYHPKVVRYQAALRPDRIIIW